MRPQDAARLHDEDFYAWTQDQAGRLRRLGAERANVDLDLDNLAEEIESMGRSEYRAIESAMERIVEHLLNLQHAPRSEPREGWQRSVLEHRLRARRDLEDNPSLRGRLDQMRTRCWPSALRLAGDSLAAAGEAGGVLPRDCPYSVDEILDPDWLPPRGGASAK